ncbi:MAG: hypothetical protein DMG56_29455, partial [Acidobacteria bacterium]
KIERTGESPDTTRVRESNGRSLTGTSLAAETQVERVRRWIENYHQIQEHLEKISAIHRELLRRERLPKRR